MGKVEKIEEVFAVVVAEAAPPPDDLLELDDGVDHAGQHDVLAGGNVHAGRQQLRRGENHGDVLVHVLEVAQVAAPDVALVGRHPADVVGVLLDQIGVQVVQLPPHLVGVFLIDAEHDGLGEAIRPLQEVGNAAGDGLGAGQQRHGPLEILGLVLLVGNLAAKAVEFAPARPPAQGVVGGHDPVDPVGGQEAVFDPLPQAVGVDGVAEVGVGVDVHVALGRGRQPKLVGRLEVFENLAPTAFVPSTAPMALVHDDEVEEVGRVLAVQARAVLVPRDGLIDGEVDFPPLADLAGRDLPAGIAEGHKGLVLRVVNEDVAIGKVENLGPAVLARAVPPSVPEFPADLESDECLPGASRHREQHPPLPFDQPPRPG